MNILVVNWTWYPSGGDWTYVNNVVNLYRGKGHQVIPFSMKDDRNFPTPWSDYFIENIDYKKFNRKNIFEGLKVISKSIYSVEAERNLEKLLDNVQIDFAHINVIHHYITPVVLKVLKKRNIPIIWTLHEYIPLCPEATFISHDEVCERCFGGKFYNCITHTCKKNSVLASAVAALENYVHKYLNYYAHVDHYVCPSEFVYQKFKSFNFFGEKLVQLYHGYDYSAIDATRAHPPRTDEKYIVFVGRLEKIKGIHTVLKAMQRCPDIKIKIVGTGTEEAALKEYQQKNNLTNVTFVGKKKQHETIQIIYDAQFLICSSEWYEVLGFTCVEAMALGKPVIGAAIGAIPEMVIDNQTGLLYEPGNFDQLAQLIKQLYSDTELIVQLGQNAERHIKAIINTENHFKGLQKLIPGL